MIIKHGKKVSKLCFGTVQLGLQYGIANSSGMPDKNSATDLLISAVEAGVTMFDTARDYGESESRIGNSIAGIPNVTIMTKLSPLYGLSENDSEAAINEQVEKSIYTSLQCLNLQSLPYLLLHRANHLYLSEGRIWKKLLELQKQGVIERLGVSVQSPEEALDALKIREIECIQLPFNILDRRYENLGVVKILLQYPQILVIARSTLLQGLLSKDAETWAMIRYDEAKKITAKLDELVVKFGRKNRVDLCFAFVRSQNWIDVIAVGMENKQQLAENLEIFELPPLSEDECRMVREQVSYTDDYLLNPALWPR